MSLVESRAYNYESDSKGIVDMSNPAREDRLIIVPFLDFMALRRYERGDLDFDDPLFEELETDLSGRRVRVVQQFGSELFIYAQ